MNVNENVKGIACAKKIIAVFLAQVFWEYKYLESIADNSVIMYNWIINVTDCVLTNTVYSANNSDNKRLRYKIDC